VHVQGLESHYSVLSNFLVPVLVVTLMLFKDTVSTVEAT